MLNVLVAVGSIVVRLSVKIFGILSFSIGVNSSMFVIGNLLLLLERSCKF